MVETFLVKRTISSSFTLPIGPQTKGLPCFLGGGASFILMSRYLRPFNSVSATFLLSASRVPLMRLLVLSLALKLNCFTIRLFKYLSLRKLETLQ